MQKNFSNELVEAVKRVAKARGIPLITTTILSCSNFQKAEEENKFSSPTICYILPDGSSVKRLNQEKRKELSEFAAIVDVQSEFFMSVFVYKD